MKRGTGILAAQALGVHPSTVSRNKERLDVSKTAAQIEYSQVGNNFLNELNKSNDVRQSNGGNQSPTNG